LGKTIGMENQKPLKVTLADLHCVFPNAYKAMAGDSFVRIDFPLTGIGSNKNKGDVPIIKVFLNEIGRRGITASRYLLDEVERYAYLPIKGYNPVPSGTEAGFDVYEYAPPRARGLPERTLFKNDAAGRLIAIKDFGSTSPALNVYREFSDKTGFEYQFPREMFKDFGLIDSEVLDVFQSTCSR
jgi:hypothetical protein